MKLISIHHVMYALDANFSSEKEKNKNIKNLRNMMHPEVPISENQETPFSCY